MRPYFGDRRRRTVAPRNWFPGARSASIELAARVVVGGKSCRFVRLDVDVWRCGQVKCAARIQSAQCDESFPLLGAIERGVYKSSSSVIGWAFVCKFKLNKSRRKTPVLSSEYRGSAVCMMRLHCDGIHCCTLAGETRTTSRALRYLISFIEITLKSVLKLW